MAMGFVDSSRSVEHAAVKSILFRCSALLLQFGTLKLFALFASMQQAYTSYLMFLEDPIQQFLFFLSRLCSLQGLTVFGFGVLFAAAGAYDVMLWALDSPGYVSYSTPVRASTVVDQLLSAPGYLLVSSELPGELASMSLPDVIGANLFKPGFNFTLTDQVDRGSREIVPPVLPFSRAWPRIWLDNEGFSVSLQQDAPVADEFSGCPYVDMPEKDTASWACNDVNKNHSLAYLDASFGMPEIWFDSSSESVYMRPSRQDNPWSSLGTGGGTAAMHQVFTVTKGRRRHTFLLVDTKATMISHRDEPFKESAIVDFLERFWGKDFGNLDVVARRMVKAQANNKGSVQGDYYGNNNNHSVTQQTFELLSPRHALLGTQIFSSLRVTYSNLTLIRSDTIPEPVTPFGSCKFSFMNTAQAGKVYGTNCATSSGTHDSVANSSAATGFLGETDTLSVFILSRALGTGGIGDGEALNQTGVDWYAANVERMANLLLARGFILGHKAQLVTIDLKQLKPAISYLQILLVVITPFVALLAWISVTLLASQHYHSSLLASLCATTHAAGDSDCKKPAYLTNPPDIQLRDDGGHTVLCTSRGTFRHDTSDGHGHPERLRDPATWDTKQPLASWREEPSQSP